MRPKCSQGVNCACICGSGTNQPFQNKPVQPLTCRDWHPPFMAARDQDHKQRLFRKVCPGYSLNIVVGMWHGSYNGTYLLPQALLCRKKVPGNQQIWLEDRFAPTEQGPAIQNENIHLLLNLCACADVIAGARYRWPNICPALQPGWGWDGSFGWDCSWIHQLQRVLFGLVWFCFSRRNF